ncbi:hypothetical protein C0992_002514, partial [Termitomyces sp. T32_za158]
MARLRHPGKGRFLLADNYWKLECYAMTKYPDWAQNHPELEEEKSNGKRSYKGRDDDSRQKKRKRLSTPPRNVPIFEIDDDGPK